MRGRIYVLCAVLLCVVSLGWHATRLFAQQPTGSGLPTARWEQSTVNDWNNGTLDGLVVTNNADGELRLDRDSQQGTYTSALFEVPFVFTAATVEWDVETPPQTTLRMEVRTSPNGTEWRDWQSVAPDGLVIAGPDLLGPISTESDSRWLQYRITFSTTAQPAVPVVQQASWFLVGAAAGPSFADLPDPVLAWAPRETYTQPPLVFPRTAWGAHTPPVAAVERPFKLQLSAIPAPENVDPPTFLRSLQQIALSYGGDDLPFAFVVDSAGNVYQGRSQSLAVDGTLAIGLLGELTEPAQQALAETIAWVAQVYHLPLSLSASGTLTPDEADRIRQAADQATVRSRWLLIANNTRDYTERLMLFNPTNTAAEVKVTFLPGQANALEQDYRVEPGERIDLQLNEVFSDTAVLPLLVTANQTIVTERTMLFLRDALNEPGIADFSRTWYFAAGDGRAGHETILWLYNPHPTEVAAQVNLIPTAGFSKTIDAVLEPFTSTPIETSGAVASTFGIEVAASAPIAAERIVRFGDEEAGGFLNRGAPAPSRTWYFAEGATIAPYTTTLALFNPLPAASAITVTFLNEQGDTFIRRYQLPPVSRLDVEMRDIVPSPQGVGTVVESSLPIVAERVTYFNAGNAGTSTLGATELAYTWYFAEGRTTDPAAEFLLLANPNPQPALVRVRIGTSDGDEEVLEYTLPRTGRLALLLDNELPFEERHTTIVESDLPIVAERSIFIDGEDIQGGHTSLGTPDR